MATGRGLCSRRQNDIKERVRKRKGRQRKKEDEQVPFLGIAWCKAKLFVCLKNEEREIRV